MTEKEGLSWEGWLSTPGLRPSRPGREIGVEDLRRPTGGHSPF